MSRPPYYRQKYIPVPIFRPWNHFGALQRKNFFHFTQIQTRYFYCPARSLQTTQVSGHELGTNRLNQYFSKFFCLSPPPKNLSLIYPCGPHPPPSLVDALPYLKKLLYFHNLDLCIWILSKFYLFTNWCTSDLSLKKILKFTLMCYFVLM